ncbi:MAG: GWxTD domain-containing protein [Lewinellaceae bacterium]|nr:GWxTD domain-containing protein [Lewinellaceae bacterium]
MKNKHTLLLALFVALLANSAAALDAGITHTVYATPEKTYLEVNIEIAAGSVTFRRVDSIHLQAGVETLILVKQGDQVINFEKYLLNSPLVGVPQDLLDVKRMFLPAGDYTLEIVLQDVHDLENKKSFSKPLQVGLGNSVYLTDLLLLRSFRPDESNNSFVKNGYFLEPLPFAFYDRQATMLAFYAEVYHSDKAISSGNYLVRYLLEQELGNGATTLISSGSQRKKPASIDALLVPMNISKIKSGNYSLTVELRNEANELLTSRKVLFQRSNPFVDMDLAKAELTEEVVEKQFVTNLNEENLRFSLRAISLLTAGDDSEMLKNILAGSDLKAMRFFLFRHFVDINPNNPELAYLEFMQVAGAADQKFRSGFRYGFETDRGRTYIRFGRPDDLIRVEDDPSAPPYEIWVYYNFPKTNQRNVKFLFYNPSLAGEDFIMLHSTARGEINNPRWEVALYGRNAGNQIEGDNYNDASTMQRGIGRNARSFFEDF